MTRHRLFIIEDGKPIEEAHTGMMLPEGASSLSLIVCWSRQVSDGKFDGGVDTFEFNLPEEETCGLRAP